MKITKLGENLYEVKVSWKTWNLRKELAKALMQIQSEGKTVTAISRHSAWDYYFLVCVK